jgi:hypothetical protein
VLAAALPNFGCNFIGGQQLAPVSNELSAQFLKLLP